MFAIAAAGNNQFLLADSEFSDNSAIIESVGNSGPVRAVNTGEGRMVQRCWFASAQMMLLGIEKLLNGCLFFFPLILLGWRQRFVHVCVCLCIKNDNPEAQKCTKLECTHLCQTHFV